MERLQFGLTCIMEAISTLKVDEDHPFFDAYREIADHSFKYLGVVSDICERTPAFQNNIADWRPRETTIGVPDAKWLTGEKPMPPEYAAKLQRFMTNTET